MDIIGLSGDDIVTILGAGISGVAFLFVVLSFILLRKEQDRDAEPRENMLKSINRFTNSTLVFAVIVGAITLYESQTSNNSDLTHACKAQIERSNVLLQSNGHTLETVKQLFSTTLSKCL